MKIKTKPKAIKLVAAVLSFLMISSVLPFFAVTASAESITPTTPQKDTGGVYQIGTAAELYGFAQLVNGGNASAKAVLTADIVVNTGVLKADGTLADDTSTFTSWTPIGDGYNRYTVTFDGQGHTVSGLYFNDTHTDYVGLFGYLAENSEIKNVGVIDSYFNGNNYIGGVCGYNYGTITGCYNTGTVSGRQNVGGVCGFNNGPITGCYNTGTVSGSRYVGGVCGWNNGPITGCYNTGTVSGSGSDVGGVCGYNNKGTTTGCYNTGTVSGRQDVGGVCGFNDYGTMIGCYNTGTVSGNIDVGGVCGWNDSTITGCYTNSGGVCGSNNGTTSSDCAEYTGNEFKDGTVCTQLNSALKNANASVRFYQGANYPEFIKNVPTLVDGVYQISNKEELYVFAQLVNGGETSASAVLTADIVVNTDVLKADGTLNTGTFTSWTPIGWYDYNNEVDYSYTGTFDGQDHTISGLYFNDTNTVLVGLFGELDSGGEIKNVGVIDSYFNGKNNVGGVSGRNYGTITGCYSTGTVSGTNNVGGVCGYNNGTITGCYNTGTVSGSGEYVGGVSGYNTGIGTITGCYNTGTVSGSELVGGVCGYNGGTITGCYNTGTVSGSGNKIGGVCGYNAGNATITACYNTGTVSGTSDFVGGVCGSNYGTITGCYTNRDSDTNYRTDTEFADGTVCTLLNTALKNANSDLCFYQGANYPKLCFIPKSVNGVYQIGTAAELYWFADKVNNDNANYGNANAVLTADIVVNTDVLKADGTLNTGTFTSWTPIGTDSNRYTGTFDGQGHTISGLYNNTGTSYVGLFGRLGSGGEIKNVGVIDSYFKGNVGVGGVCGWNSGGTITGCYNTGTVSGSKNVGGVCGYNIGTITGSYNTGTVSGSGNDVGGVCGFNELGGTITGCYNIGTVSGSQNVGGVCGQNMDGSTITGSYNTGTVSGSQNVGGVCGYDDGEITGCYNTGTVSGSNFVGGVCGRNSGTITGCYTNRDSDQYYEPNEKFANGTVCKLLNTALQNANSDVHFYQGVKSPEFIRTPQLVNNVYQISCASELYGFAQLVNNGETSASAVLTADITVNSGLLSSLEFDASGNLTNGDNFLGWTPIGKIVIDDQSGSIIEDFCYYGTFDGQGHTVSGLYFNDTNTINVGLFGCLGSGGEIKNVGVIDSYFNGHYGVGGVCGYNYGTITGCYNTGTFSCSGDFVGGVCGYNNGTMTDCYNTGTVSCNSKVGGVCGSNSGTMTDCYNTGTVSGNLGVGGVCGDNYEGTITGCYNTGTVSGTDGVGGVCGDNYEGTITGCYNNGTVSGTDYVGGVCGYNDYGTMTVCYNTGKVGGTDYVGGVCGYNNEGTIAGCYNTGEVSGTGSNSKYIGGVCGDNYEGTITGCYNTGTVSGSGNKVGGVCGYNDYGTITGCYNTGTVSGDWFVGGVCGDNDGEIIDCYTNRDSDEYYEPNENFANGTVCKLLNTALQNENYEVRFCQRIGTDASPLLTYQFESVDEHTYGVYRCENNTFKATCFCEQKSEKTMELTLKTEKAVVANGADNTLTATLSNLENEAVTYKWYQDNVLIQNATSSTYKMPKDLSIGTHTYRVEVTMADVGTITQSVDVLVDITPQYIVEIPASVNIGDSFTVSASNVLLKSNAKLKVGIESDFTLSTPKGSLLNYEILNNSGKLTSGDTLLTVAGSENPTAPGSDTSDTYNVALAQGEKPKYSGNYTDTLTFTIKVEQ